MKALLAISLDSYKKLYRDRVFIPAVTIAVIMMIAAIIISDFGVMEVYKYIYDLGSSSYLFIGCLTGIFWGANLVADARSDGSMETQLSAPISRSTWIIGKFIGLFLVKMLLSLILICFWQLLFISLDYGSFTVSSLLSFLSLSLCWLSMDALTILFSVISSKSVALFGSFSLFIIGLMTGPIYQTLSAKTDPTTRNMISKITGIWDLSYFNLSTYLIKEEVISLSIFLPRLYYALAIVLACMSLSILIFSSSDLQK